MDISPARQRPLRHGLLFTITALASSLVVAAPGELANVPLFATNAVKPNIMLILDDSGSMDAEVLFATDDGAARLGDKTFKDPVTDIIKWSGKTFVEPETGELVYGGTRYDYLFPNGTDLGNRVYSGRHGVPPLPQYAFARSSDFNLIYYNPDLTYKPWPASGYTDVDPTKAPSDPAIGDFTFDLTDSIENSNSNHVFYMYQGMTIPEGTRYWNGSGWNEATADIELDQDRDVAISYKPATYYRTVTTGTYSVADFDGGTVLGDCSATNSDHYVYFHASPGNFSSASVDALGPKGECLEKVEIAAGTAEMQNFANWFSYYRKRHLALRAGVGSAFKGVSGIRLGMFTINNRHDVTMMDFDTQASTFFSELYGIGGKAASTPNRQALQHAGEQFKRTDAEAPIIEACQRNYTIQFTDGFTNSFGSVTGAGNADGDKGTPYADGYSDTWADFAMKYYTENLQPTRFAAGKLTVPKACDEPNPDPSLDCNNNLHMNTITVGLGVAGEIFGQTHFKVADAYKTPYPVWPSVGSVDLRQFDDLYHAAVNGRGETYNAATAYELGDVMREALKYVKSGEGAGSAASFNSTEQDGDKRVYVGLFNTADWSGDFIALPVNTDGDIQAAKSWSAADKLNQRSFSTRNIVTYDGSNGIPFEWSRLSPSQQADLKINPDGALGDDAIGQARLNYIMGDHSEEALSSGASYDFRDRNSRLGDIVHSQSVYVPYENSEDIIFVGANDGMLHAFIAEGDNAGKEAFAYIPNSLFSTDNLKGLHYLTDPYYRHRYYVDLTPTVVKNTGVGGGTTLVGGLRGGGRGIFALDIGNGASFNENDVLWEFTDPDLGYTYSNITLAKMNDGQWAAVFGNGYCDEGPACGSGEAQLFIVSLVDGSLIKKITTGAGDTTTRNGLSTPGVADLDADGRADWVYAGDLFGNLWAFDLTGEDPADWQLAYGNALFKTPANQPITSEPMIVKHPQVYDDPISPAEFHARTNLDTNYPNTLVLFGTGQYLIEGDKTSTDKQAFYGIWDDGTGSQYPLAQSNLQEQTYLTNVTSNFRALTQETVDYTAEGSYKEYGWYLELPASKERVINRATVRNNVVFFDTIIPSNSPCDYGGAGYLMAVNLLNGGRMYNVEFDANDDTHIDEYDKVTADVDGQTTTVPPSGRYHDGGMPISEIMDNDIITNDTNQPDGVPRQTPIKPAKQGRLSWEELES